MCKNIQRFAQPGIQLLLLSARGGNSPECVNERAQSKQVIHLAHYPLKIARNTSSHHVRQVEDVAYLEFEKLADCDLSVRAAE